MTCYSDKIYSSSNQLLIGKVELDYLVNLFVSYVISVFLRCQDTTLRLLRVFSLSYHKNNCFPVHLILCTTYMLTESSAQDCMYT